MDDSEAYIGMNVQSRTCTMVWMNKEGNYREPSTYRNRRFRKCLGEIFALALRTVC